MATCAQDFVGDSSVIRDLDHEIHCVAPTDAKILITGESGVGKEVVAHLIHARSRRSAAPFVIVNCAGVPETLLESELFGHVKGSFTGAYRDKTGRLDLAHGGTVFLDEIGEMSLRMQSLLLRFLETGERQRVGSTHGGGANAGRIDTRVIVATNRDLAADVAAGTFREDLYYRLNVIHIDVPPLRDRLSDLPALAEYFLASFAAQYGVARPTLTGDALDGLGAHPWPGNVRELRNVMERLVVNRGAAHVTWQDLPEEIRRSSAVAAGAATTGANGAADDLVDQMVRGGHSFWSVVYTPFRSRDLTRDDLRAVVRQGLARSRGSYRVMVKLFNLDDRDYRSFMRALRKCECHVPYREFRTPRGAAAA